MSIFINRMKLDSYLNDYVKKRVDICCNKVSNLSKQELFDDKDGHLTPNFAYIASSLVKFDDKSINFDQSSLILANIIANIGTAVDYSHFKLNYFAYFVVQDENSARIVSYLNSIQSSIETYAFLLNLFTIFELNLRLVLNRNDHLLRNLIENNDKLIKDLFGVDFSDTLKVFLCSPYSLNIRNLIWHGFLSLNEGISTNFVKFMLLLMNYIGYCIFNKRIEFPHRNPTYNFPIDHNIEAKFNNFLENSQLNSILESNKDLIDDDRRLIIDFIINQRSYNKKETLMLIITLLEFFLRKLFCIKNKLDLKVALCAMESQYYLTMNEILSEYYMDQKNRLIEYFNVNYVIFLYDLFMYEDGPRIRDRLSHGGSFLDYNSLINLIFYQLVALFNHNHDTKVILDDYKCQYHPVSLVRKHLYALWFILDPKIDVPNDENSKYLFLFRDKNNESIKNCIKLVNILQKILKNIEKFTEKCKNFEFEASLGSNTTKRYLNNLTQFYKFDYKSSTIETLKIISKLTETILDRNYSLFNDKLLKSYQRLLSLYENLTQESLKNRWYECYNLIESKYKLILNKIENF